MAVVLEAVPFGASRRERQDGIETVQGLNGGLLIDAEHGRMLRRAQIEAEDVSGFASSDCPAERVGHHTQKMDQQQV